ncbi:hypothetical protein [Methylobacterium nigriterrae]|uniref:hypothetical protein n=1 Tax=Methylobacterium nigriterrae TaxID=3127512 RepID=UPI0030139069
MLLISNEALLLRISRVRRRQQEKVAIHRFELKMDAGVIMIRECLWSGALPCRVQLVQAVLEGGVLTEGGTDRVQGGTGISPATCRYHLNRAAFALQYHLYRLYHPAEAGWRQWKKSMTEAGWKCERSQVMVPNCSELSRPTMRYYLGLIALCLCGSVSAAEPPRTVERLLADGWDIAGYAGTLDNRSTLILFRKKDTNFLVQCSILYDVTRSQRVVTNCYELH